MKNKKIFAGLLVAVVLVVGALFANNTNFFRGALVDSILSGEIPEEAGPESCERVLKEMLLLASEGYRNEALLNRLNFLNNECGKDLELGSNLKAFENKFVYIFLNSELDNFEVKVSDAFLNLTDDDVLTPLKIFRLSILSEDIFNDYIEYLGELETEDGFDFEEYSSIYELLFLSRGTAFREKLDFETDATVESCNLVSELAELSDSEEEFLGRLFFERQKRLTNADCLDIEELGEDFNIDDDFEDDED